VSDQIPKQRQIAIGVFWGLIATFAWAGYNVAAKIGRLEGFTPADLTMLRYGGGALFFLPFMFGPSGSARLSLRNTILSACIIGPGFGMIVNTAFGLAPLSHAVIIGPGSAMIVGNLLPVFLDRKTLQPTRWIGMAVLFAGLLVIGFHRQDSVDQSGDWVWLGDLGFIATGALWAVFGYLLDRWKVNAFTGVGQVVVLSALLFAPLYFLFFEHHQAAPLSWVTQVFYQGGLGGFLGLAAYALTVARLGAAPASLLPAFVPSSAILLAIPLMGAFPSPLEVFGVCISTIGLLTAINLNWWQRRSSANDN
jgi:drug/metabolite transporter (DMT)-like permease